MVCRSLLALGLLWMVGCTTFRSPSLSVDEVAMTGATDEALALEFVMELRNPNNAPVELYEFRYRLSIDGRKVYTGRRDGGATLSAGGQRQLAIPAVVPYDVVGWTPQHHPPHADYTLAGKLLYNAPSQIAQLLFDTGVRRPKVAFSKRGRINLQ